QDAAKLPPALPTRSPLLRQPTALVSNQLFGGYLESSLSCYPASPELGYFRQSSSAAFGKAAQQNCLSEC
ncbi:hypothetical protein, partial [Algoriphagus formosus]|uniref:hypothetical protein n=1 Tax=Algoriphagus formosus TaxID=2007308 RepID=UPI003F6E9051